jgi:20S proteasome subunit beta 5
VLTTAYFQPAEFCRNNLNCGYHQDHAQDIQFAKGTTTLGFKFQGGIIISVDSRSTMGPYIGTLTQLPPV